MRRSHLLLATGSVVSIFAICTWRSSHNKSDPAGTTAAEPALSLSKAYAAERVDPNVALAGLDLTRISVDDNGASAPVSGDRVARLTIDPDLQQVAKSLIASQHLPEAAVVMMDVQTSQVLVYASHIEKGSIRDLCAEATAPAASVFKVVTASALVEDAHLGPDTKQCYSGGEQRIHASDLVDDPSRDRWCATLGGAMGRSINTIFARLAKNHLKPAQLETMARQFGFGEAVPFDVPVQPSAVSIPTEPLEFARTAAGFWNTTLSPMQGAWLSATIARGGEAFRPSIVREVVSQEGERIFSASPSPLVRRVISRDTASALTTMMDRTVAEGTSFRAFHGPNGRSFLPGIPVAGKTGTLTDPQSNRLVTWFTGFAPSHNATKMVAISVLVLNDPVWHVKANVIARDMLRAYFAKDRMPGVTKPSTTSIARRRR